MTTLMTVGNSEGERRCDARCYEGTGSDCDCICGGMNHGKGLEAARDNTREHGRRLLEAAKAKGSTSAGEILQELFK